MAINFMDDLLFVRMTKTNSRCLGKSFLTKFQLDLMDCGETIIKFSILHLTKCTLLKCKNSSGRLDLDLNQISYSIVCVSYANPNLN